MEAFEVSGQWWLPEAPEHRVGGTLMVSNTGRGELVLMGALRSYLEAGQSHTEGGTTTVTFTEDSMARSGRYPRILGQAGVTYFTLNDCFQTLRSGQFFGGLETERVHVHQVFKGLWMEEEEPARFNKIYLRMDWLAYWVMQSGLEESMDFTEDEDGLENRSVTLKVRKIPIAEFSGPEGSVISLGQNYGVVGDRIVERKLTQDFYFAIAYDRSIELVRLLEEAGDLQDLVSIGTARKAAYSKVSLRHADGAELIGGKIYDTPIDFYAQWNTGINEHGTKTLTETDMFFTFKDLGGTEGVERWLAVAARNRSALSRVMWCHYSESMVVTDRLLNCAASLEAYDRSKYADESYYVDRLRRCAATAGPLFQELVGDTATWATTMKDGRNAVAHHFARMDGSSTADYSMSQSAYWLFILCLLKDCGAPDAVFNRMREHGQFRWLQREISDLLQSSGSVSRHP